MDNEDLKLLDGQCLVVAKKGGKIIFKNLMLLPSEAIPKDIFESMCNHTFAKLKDTVYNA